MSKYGFNENEVKRTIVTMIDKDGFHKETVYDGKYEAETTPGDTAEFNAEGQIWSSLTSGGQESIIVVANVPDNAEVFGIHSTTDRDYILNIGDIIEDPPSGDGIVYSSAFSILSTIKAAYSMEKSSAKVDLDRFHQIYAVDSTSHEVIKRVKIELAED